MTQHQIPPIPSLIHSAIARLGHPAVVVLALATAMAPACSDSGSSRNDDVPDVEIAPTEEVEATPARSDGRQFRRMDLDQLEASITQVSGGVLWTEVDENGETFEVLDSLSGSLGKPDFLDSNTEDLDPGLLFLKFLDDAANAVCRAWVAREYASPSGRLLVAQADFSDTPVSNPAAIEANIQALLLRFHGKPAEADDPRLGPWTALFRRVWQIRSDTRDAWRTVCVAMFTHPDFYTF